MSPSLYPMTHSVMQHQHFTVLVCLSVHCVDEGMVCVLLKCRCALKKILLTLLSFSFDLLKVFFIVELEMQV